MNRKFKFISLGASMVLSLGVMLTGVFAATSHSVTISNNVSFSASNNVKATISYSIFGATDSVTNGTDLIVINENDDNSGQTSLQIPEIKFKDSATVNSTISLNICIRNYKKTNLYIKTTGDPTFQYSQGSSSNLSFSSHIDDTYTLGDNRVQILYFIYTLLSVSEDVTAGWDQFGLILSSTPFN